MTTTIVKFPQGKNSYNMLTLKADKRIKYDSVRVLRTLKPKLGLMYADRRKKGIRYKIAFSGMTLPQKKELVILLNKIYMMNNMSTIAYLHEPQGGAPWKESAAVCLFVKDWQ